MINKSKNSSLVSFLIDQAKKVNIVLDSTKAKTVDSEINKVVNESKKFTDRHRKSSTQAELKIRLRSVLDQHNLPIVEQVYEEILRRAGNSSTPKSYWFVGASYGGSEDQTERFISEGIWQNGYKDKYLDVVRSMQPGDRIAIKSSYTRKRNLPLDSKGQTVSVMGIKAIGVVTKNHGDGRYVDVDWEPRFDPVKEWYFYTNRSTVWRIIPGEWMTDDLINFTFSNGTQDIDRFRNAPFWKERFGETPADDQRFLWSRFYEAIADGLIAYQDNRDELITFITQLADRFDLSYIKDKQLEDIDPFTVMGLFNRGITDDNRKAIAKDLADFLGVDESVPESFEGIPILNNQKSWFFGFEEKRDPEDIESPGFV